MKYTIAAIALLALFLAGCATPPPPPPVSTVETHFDKDGKKTKEVVTESEYVKYTQAVSNQQNKGVKLVEMDCRGVPNCFSGKMEVYAPPGGAAAAQVVIAPPPGPPEGAGWKIYREIKEAVVGVASEAKQVAGVYYPWKFGTQMLGKIVTEQKPGTQVNVDGSNGVAMNFGQGSANALANTGRIGGTDTTTTTTTTDNSDRRQIAVNCGSGPAAPVSSTGATSPPVGAATGSINCPVDAKR